RPRCDTDLEVERQQLVVAFSPVADHARNDPTAAPLGRQDLCARGSPVAPELAPEIDFPVHRCAELRDTDGLRLAVARGERRTVTLFNSLCVGRSELVLAREAL